MISHPPSLWRKMRSEQGEKGQEKIMFLHSPSAIFVNVAIRRYARKLSPTLEFYLVLCLSADKIEHLNFQMKGLSGKTILLL